MRSRSLKLARRGGGEVPEKTLPRLPPKFW